MKCYAPFDPALGRTPEAADRDNSGTPLRPRSRDCRNIPKVAVFAGGGSRGSSSRASGSHSRSYSPRSSSPRIRSYSPRIPATGYHWAEPVRGMQLSGNKKLWTVRNCTFVGMLNGRKDCSAARSMACADPVLETSNEDGWTAFCSSPSVGRSDLASKDSIK